MDVAVLRNIASRLKAVAIFAVAAAVFSCLPGNGFAAVFDQPSTSSSTNRISGTTPSGLTWESVATGTALPIRSSGTQNGAPGAVAYWNTTTGQLQIDPKGWNLSLFNFTYTTGTVNTSGSTAGPLLYASGTSPTSSTVSGATGLANQKTLPAGSWTLITCAPARIAGTVSLVRSPTLSTSYDAGNGAAGTSPYATNPLGEAVTPGWMTQPWAFPLGMVNSGSVSSMVVSNWKTFGVAGNPYANVLGYGNYQSTFQYTVDGVTGNMVGPVIPVTTSLGITINVASGVQTQTQAGYPLLSGVYPVDKTGPGTLVLDQANTLAADLSVRGGTVRLDTASTLTSGRLIPYATGTVGLASQVRATVAGLSPNAGGVVDLGTGALTVSSGLSAVDLRTALLKGLAGGAWTGTSGIVSSAAATSVAAGIPRTVGWLDNGNGSLTVGFAAPGDANLDGMIDMLDAAVLLGSNGYGNGSAATWQQGDFNYDGLFDILDVAAFASTNLYNTGAYNAPATEFGALVAVPEPTGASMVLAAIGCVAMVVRKRLSR